VTQVRNGAYALWRYLTPVFFVATIVLVFLAGLGVFRSDNEGQNKKFGDAFSPHKGLGGVLQLGALILLILALIAWRDRRAVGSSAALLVLMVLQSVFASAGEHHPWVGAFHPLNGFIILGLSGSMAFRAWMGRAHMQSRAEPAPTPPA
jgi:hypothetical protein